MNNIVCYIHKNFQHTELLKKFIKDDVTLEIDNIDKILENQLLIVRSNKFGEGIEDVLYWDDVFSQFYNYTLTLWGKNYDRYFLDEAITDAKQNDYEAIIVGSSYARFGFDEKEFSIPIKNMSLISQDLYYGCSVAQNILEVNDRIKKVIIGMGYYYLFSDLSKTKDEGEILRVSNVYHSLFKDGHNALTIPETYQTMQSAIWDVENIIKLFSTVIYQDIGEEYFHKGRTRFQYKSCMWDDCNKSWDELTEGQKDRAGEARARLHNKSIKHQGTYLENINILSKFMTHCETKNVEVYICIFPASKSYNKYFDFSFKKIFYETLAELPQTVHLIDFNNSDDFDDGDFNDMDHLNDRGAKRVTNLLNAIL